MVALGSILAGHAETGPHEVTQGDKASDGALLTPVEASFDTRCVWFTSLDRDFKFLRDCAASALDAPHDPLTSTHYGESARTGPLGRGIVPPAAQAPALSAASTSPAVPM